jgi:hypothetical protein
MLHKCKSGPGSEITYKNTTHRSTNCTTGNCELNALIPFKAVNIACRKKVRGFLRTTQDLEQHGNSGGVEGRTIDSELKEGNVLAICKTMSVRSVE